MSRLLLFILISSCAQVTSLNMKKHQYGVHPKKIVWIQVAGLESEHLALIKFPKGTAEPKLAFEEFSCVGQVWSYNLYHLRPNANLNFWTQLTGKKDVKGECQDYEHKPIWDYLYQSGYKNAVLEVADSNNSGIIKTCDGASFVSNWATPIWLARKPFDYISSKTVNFNETLPMENGVFWDQSCFNKNCQIDMFRTALRGYEELRKKSEKFFFLMRDFTFSEALESKDFVRAQQQLQQIEKIVSHFQREQQQNSDLLILVTSSHAKTLQFPSEGKNWAEFEVNGKNANQKESRLMGGVWAIGARAENFCGIFEEAEIMQRILSGPKQQGFEFKIINPFGI